MPPHAAGGWPSDLSADTKRPGRTPEQQAQLDSVANELARVARVHGPDSVILQSKLLVRAMSAGALGPTEVRVAGASRGAAPRHLQIEVATGLFFDEARTTVDSRRDEIWKSIAMPVLDEMVSFKIEPAGLELVFVFDVQDTTGKAVSDLDPGAPARREGFRVQLGPLLLEDMLADRLAVDALRGKVEFVPAVIEAAPEAGFPTPGHNLP